MTAFGADDSMGLAGYRMDQLASAFDRVRHPHDWKAPIRAEIPAEERPVVEKAVWWFTRTIPVFEPVPGAGNRLMVVAGGYRAWEAGDTPDSARV